MTNTELQTLAQAHAQAWARLGALDDERSYADGLALVRRLRSLEDLALPLPVYSFADLQAKARIAATWAEAGGGDEEMLSFIVAALVAGIEALARVAPVSEPFEFH